MEQALAGGGAEIEPEAGVVTAGVEAGTGVRNKGKKSDPFHRFRA